MVFITITVRRRREIFVNNKIASFTFKACLNLEKIYKCNIEGFVIMPDHIHFLSNSLFWVNRFKGYLSKNILRMLEEMEDENLVYFFLKRAQQNKRWYRMWEKNSFYTKGNGKKFRDNHIQYMRNNPVKAGLVKRPEDYPWLYIKR